MREYIDNGEEIIIVEDEQKDKAKPKFFNTKAGKIALAATFTIALAGGIALAFTRTSAYKSYKELKGCSIERVEAVPTVPNGSYLTYIKDDKGNDVLVCATETTSDCYLAPDYVECDGLNIIRDSEDLKCYYEKEGKRISEAKPIVLDGYELVWTEDNGYMLYKENVSVTYSNPTYIIPDGYALKKDENGYYGIKIESETKQEEKGKVIGQKNY